MITVIVPAYNEEALIRKNTLLIKEEMDKITSKTKDKYEIIIVEESKDRTPEEAKRLAMESKRIRHFHSDVRLGKGGAIEKGVSIAKGDKIIFMDIDLSTSLEITGHMLKLLDSYDIAITSRYNGKSKIKRSIARAVAGWGFSILARILLGTRLRDTKCGFKAFRKDTAERIIPYIENRGWFWDTEFLVYAEKAGYSIKEVPIDWYERKESNVFIADNTIDMLKNLKRMFFRVRTRRIRELNMNRRQLG